MNLPKIADTEKDRKSLADLYFAAALAAWDGDLEAAGHHARTAEAMADRARTAEARRSGPAK